MARRTYLVALYGRDTLPSVSEILAVFSWQVVRAATAREAIGLALREFESPPGTWKWALLRYPVGRKSRQPIRIDALRLTEKEQTP